ncbi:Pup--protein ligase [Kocuria sp. ZOR0020]|uniref:Pup--protein ligase n=1 Tax=Kocuria sp. ZOR0020 TaxID=1339234 RepID=UPI00068D8F93|nr:Pup--protein ligase [Kocuria sp. ZOR0020]
MDRRIMGLETEFGIVHTVPTGAALSPDDTARRLFRPIVEWGRSSNVFLPNGARLYLDVGSHPEYATAECATLEDTVAHDRAGELIVDDMRGQLEAKLAEEGTGGSVYLFKNNVDSAGNSFGSHENYMIARSTRFARLVAHLIPFLVTRQLIAGAGRVHPQGPVAFGQRSFSQNAGQPSYSFSQRADHIWEDSSSSTTRARPLINTRDEPHGDAERFRRLHVIVGDSTMSTTTTALRLGATDLMLRMIEAGNALIDRTLKDPALALRQISHDLTGTVPVELADGTQRSALDLQREYLETVTRFVQANGAHHDRVDWVLDLWARTLDAVQRRDVTGIDTEIDWAIKKKLLDSWVARNGSDYAAPRVAQMDLAFHDVAPGRGLFRMLEERGMAARLPGTDGSEAQTAVTTPPETRAKIRGALVKAAIDAGKHTTIDWVNVKINGATQRIVTLRDPFLTHDDDAAAMLAILRREAVRGSEQPPAPPII